MKAAIDRLTLGGAVLFLCLTCRSPRPMEVSGQLENIPDGEMVFFTRENLTGKMVKLDSCALTNGKFRMLFSREKYPEAVRIFVNHKEQNTDTLRVLSFDTHILHGGHPLGVDHFYLEDGIQLNGKISEMSFRGFRPYSHVKLVKLDRPLVEGRQTAVAYSDSVGFGRLRSVARLRDEIRKHPYSFYYLYELERRMGGFSDESFRSLLDSFEEDVRESPTGRKLRDYIASRKSHRLSFATRLADEQGALQPVLDPSADYQLVVLWASWCGPCRREIPELKKLYARLGNDEKLRLVSVSLDENRAAWHKALQKEQMPWPQRLMTESERPYTRDLFQFDGSIPTMLLLDRQGRTLKKVTGYDANNLKTIERLITRSNQSLALQ
ncbi:thioredoxin-like domain-containing protein [Tellurirhabdus rosea]|uniref:thioredoxin-like domain-containing protein n=1 Tax=Tellurirhabdus rosea TaxID=2674997 RepID=UPI00225A3EBC|nr:TlpA disulfide reductase family protein [Tellurirhabdus rosea]